MDELPLSTTRKRGRQRDSHDHDSDPQNNTETSAVMSRVTKKARKATERGSSLPPKFYSLPMYCFNPLPSGYIRLLQLMPHRDKSAPIRCQLIDYPLLGPESSEGTHLYEALSYVWGSPDKSQFIRTEAGFIAITQNLHAALSRLRDRTFPRIIWADGICINQVDLKERACQVPIMAIIYAKASRVIVWLEEPVDRNFTTNGDQALEAIRIAGQTQSTYLIQESTDPTDQGTDHDDESTGDINESTNHIDEKAREAILTLLRRSWFQRVWVLQEIAAARQIIVLTSGNAIEGYGFCLGLRALNFVFEDPSTESLVQSMTNLIEGAVFRSKNIIPSTVSSLGQLIDTYHTRQATDRRDKIYALLGMCSNNQCILADYDMAWSDLFRLTIKTLIGQEAFVDTWDEVGLALIRTKGYIIGTVEQISSERTSTGRQTIGFLLAPCVSSFKDFNNVFPNISRCLETPRTTWVIQTTAKPIKENDIVCFIGDASTPAIIRVHKDYCTIIAISVTPLDNTLGIEIFHYLVDAMSRPQPNPPLNFLLLWDWEESSGLLETDYSGFELLQFRVRDRLNIKLSDHWDEAVRYHIMGLMLLEMKYPWKAIDFFRRAIELYGGKLEMGRLLNIPGVPADHDPKFVRRLRLIANIIGGKRIELSVTHNDVLEAARDQDLELMRFLFDRMGNEVQITESVLEAALGNYHHAIPLIPFLIQKRADKTVVTERMLVGAVQRERCAKEVLALLLNEQVDTAAITELVFRTALQCRYHARDLLDLLLSGPVSASAMTWRVIVEASNHYDTRLTRFLHDQLVEKNLHPTESLTEGEKRSSSPFFLNPGEDMIEKFLRDSSGWKDPSKRQSLIHQFGPKREKTRWPEIMTNTVAGMGRFPEHEYIHRSSDDRLRICNGFSNGYINSAVLSDDEGLYVQLPTKRRRQEFPYY
ncbi:hypothetical protein RRF57_011751 [Xylaria bambusicola]|uniref:Heterokaryon incompatibility domain-containing protein n=1 Tax=Xylaria bambusicola TaxID=326684 RepID=A0AAN7UX58_9PEZI